MTHHGVMLDPDMPWHPKVAALPVDQRWAYLCSIAYSYKWNTDGIVPAPIAESWEGQAAAAALVGAGLWLAFPDGHYTVHDYLDWNLSRTERETGRERARERAAKSRRARGAQSSREGGKGGGGSSSSLVAVETPSSPQGVGGSGGKGAVRARDPLWDAVEAWYGSRPSGDERGAWNRALKVFREAQPPVTPEEIPVLFDEARRQWQKPFKPTGVASNLSALRVSVRHPNNAREGNGARIARRALGVST